MCLDSRSEASLELRRQHKTHGKLRESVVTCVETLTRTYIHKYTKVRISSTNGNLLFISIFTIQVTLRQFHSCT